MDIKKIKIGNQTYDIVDEGARGGLTTALTNIVNALISTALQNSGSSSGSGITQETDPIFTAHIASKLVCSVDSQGILTLIGV